MRRRCRHGHGTPPGCLERRRATDIDTNAASGANGWHLHHWDARLHARCQRCCVHALPTRRFACVVRCTRDASPLLCITLGSGACTAYSVAQFAPVARLLQKASPLKLPAIIGFAVQDEVSATQTASSSALW